MGTTDIVQAMVSPVEKLIETVSGAIGKIYEPRHVRKMAEAKAYELKLIADAVRNNKDLPVVYNTNGFSIDTSSYEEIAKRASHRLVFQEYIKQQNIEAVVDRAYEELSGEESVSSEPVSRDWMFRFFNSIEDVSNEKIQEIWAHILAGEIRLPNTYNYRTLECLRHITQQEVDVFRRVLSLTLQSSGAYFIVADNELLNKYDVYFSDVLKLEECGLMNAQNLSLTLATTVEQKSYIFNSKYIGLIKGEKQDVSKIALSVFTFTGSGIQLMKAIQPECPEQYLFDYLQIIADKNKDFSITAHKINSINEDGSINYNTDIFFITDKK